MKNIPILTTLAIALFAGTPANADETMSDVIIAAHTKNEFVKKDSQQAKYMFDVVALHKSCSADKHLVTAKVKEMVLYTGDAVPDDEKISHIAKHYERTIAPVFEKKFDDLLSTLTHTEANRDIDHYAFMAFMKQADLRTDFPLYSKEYRAFSKAAYKAGQDFGNNTPDGKTWEFSPHIVFEVSKSPSPLCL